MPESQFLSENQITFLEDSAKFLAYPHASLKILSTLNLPSNLLLNKLPNSLHDLIGRIVQSSLRKALEAALLTLDTTHLSPEHIWSTPSKISIRKNLPYSLSLASTGAMGGFMGAAGLWFELPLTTTIILRGIAEVASRWGHELSDPEVQLQCLFVFSMSYPNSNSSQNSELPYMSSRLAYDRLIISIARMLSQTTPKEVLRGFDSGIKSATTYFIQKLARSFETSVAEKLILESLPLIGAIGGASINLLFSDFYLKAANCHFGILQLEKAFGQEDILKYLSSLIERKR